MTSSIYYAMGPSLIAILSSTSAKGIWLLMANPMVAMYEITQPKVTGAIATGKTFSWGMHCLIMLAVSSVFVLGTIIKLRQSILTFAFENAREPKSLWYKIKNFLLGQSLRYPLELRNLSSTRTQYSFRELMLFALLVIGFGASYVCLYFGKGGFGQAVFSAFSTTVWLVVFIRTTVAASTAITREKENKTLSALLCCPIKSGQIIRGKAKYIYRSNYVGWAVLTINAASALVIYSLFIYKNASFGSGGVVWMSIFSLLSVIGDLIFIIGFGLYLSVRLKSSTAAVVAGLLGYLIWYFLRYIVMFIPNFLSTVMGFYMLSFYIRPFVDIAVGLLFLWRAKCSLRKYAFK